MIGYLEGKVIYSGKDYVCVNVNGVGYNVSVNTNTLSEVALNPDVSLYTYTNLSQDAITLIGFLSVAELEVFKQLIGVSGVGPKAGLAILDCMTVDDLMLAIASGDAKAISKAKGVGAKAAEKIIIELKDKVTIADVLSSNVSGAAKQSGKNSGVEAEAVSALMALGYSQSESFKAVRSVEGRENMSTEDLLSNALLLL